ncbi:GNAT family N-acetyltransferase [Halobellus sp. GM3]|uniref:GNAT family N-acetyltransferase n=1 Tax=Halobellus sp. GM3 TaxID=3458410 RepID=UPI00403DAE06
MSIDVRTPADAAEWNALLDRTTDATPFHRHGALEVFASHTGTTLHPLVGFKGQEPVGLLPLFELRKGPVAAAFSPPPGRKISYLGPVFLWNTNAKQRKREKTHSRFVESVVAYADEVIGPRYVNVRTPPAYDDPRPFLWDGFDPTPRYTYHVDLNREPEEILADASSDLRSNVRNTDDGDFEISRGGRDGMRRVVQNAQKRHAEQDVAYGVTPSFVGDLDRALGEGIESHVCTVDGEFVGGMIALVDDEAVYRWQSVVDFESSVPAQDLLDWHAIRRGIERGCDRYDLVGANDQRLCGYKAKFAPEVATYYELERSGLGMNLVAEAYRRLR